MFLFWHFVRLVFPSVSPSSKKAVLLIWRAFSQPPINELVSERHPAQVFPSTKSTAAADQRHFYFSPFHFPPASRSGDVPSGPEKNNFLRRYCKLSTLVWASNKYIKKEPSEKPCTAYERLEKYDNVARRDTWESRWCIEATSVSWWIGTFIRWLLCVRP